MINLYDFIAKYNGKTGVGNTNANKGQCVGLISMWVDNLKLDHVWGDAKDLFKNASEDQWEKIKNSPSVYPRHGDIITMDKSWGGGAGHTAVVVSSDPKEDSYTVFEQNNPGNVPGLACEITTYKKWAGVIGWIRAKDVGEENCDELQKKLDQAMEDLIGVRKSRDEWERRYNDLLKSSEKSEKDLKEHIESLQKTQAEMNLQIISLNKQVETLTREKESLSGACRALEGQIKTLSGSVEELNVKLNAQYTKEADLQQEITKLKEENKNVLKNSTLWEFIKAKLRG